jgi:hypothetical protein
LRWSADSDSQGDPPVTTLTDAPSAGTQLPP